MERVDGFAGFQRLVRRTPGCRRLPFGVEVGQLGFVALVLAMGRSFRVLEVRWPRWVRALPAYTVGTLGAFWTIQRVALLFEALR